MYPTIRNWQDAKTFLAGGRSKEKRPLGWHTSLEARADDSVAVKYHATDVVTYYSNGSVRLQSDGWRTVTTKNRMNEFSPLNVYANGGIWYVTMPEDDIPYSDGMLFSESGELLGGEPPDISMVKDQRKAAKKYAKGFVAALQAGEIDPPGNGDCFGCLMKATDGSFPMGGASHILSHFEEDYYVPSLVLNAMDRFGASPVMQEMVHSAFHKRENPYGSWGGVVYPQIEKTIRRWCYHELGLSV